MKVGRRMSERYLSVGSVGVTLGDPSLPQTPLHNHQSPPPWIILPPLPLHTTAQDRIHRHVFVIISFATILGLDWGLILFEVN